MGWNASDTRPLTFDRLPRARGEPARPARRRLPAVPAHPRHRPHRRRGDGRRPRAGRARRGARLRQGAPRVRQADLEVPGDPGQARRHVDRDRGGAAARLQGGVREGPGPQLQPHRRAGEAQERPPRRARRRGGRADPRRLRLHRGVPGLPLLPRREDPHDRRGHRRGAADGDRDGRSGERADVRARARREPRRDRGARDADARRLGIESVAVYSDADADAPHVRAADRAVRLGPAPAAESYLLIERVVEAALRTGAEAIHPGYGLLSERAEFARAVRRRRAGLRRAEPEAIALLGDKAAAKDAADAAGVPVVPGLHARATLSDERDRRRGPPARSCRCCSRRRPAAAGAGCASCARSTSCPRRSRAARREALAAFGDDGLLVERYLERPRHIEVQVSPTRTARVLHLGERECSLQRRHQKLIEESPSPVVDAELRARMGAAAVELARSAATPAPARSSCSRARDDPSQFFFLELNARLQVEHPVTELGDRPRPRRAAAAGRGRASRSALRQEDVQLDGPRDRGARLRRGRRPTASCPRPGAIVAYREPRRRARRQRRRGGDRGVTRTTTRCSPR